jgi:hypothetical protein
MYLKAESLYEAGIIDTDEMNAVLERACAVLDPSGLLMSRCAVARNIRTESTLTVPRRAIDSNDGAGGRNMGLDG